MSNQPIALNDRNFDATVKDASQPVLIDFYADWCGPCKAIAPVIEELAAEFDGRALVAKVNVDDAPQLASKFRVQSIPTLVIVQNGEVVEQIVGLATKRVLSQKLESRLAVSPR